MPLIFLTGYDPEVLPEAWRDRPRLAKPIGLRELRDEVEKAPRVGGGE